ncbi:MULTISPECIES: molybdenum cofactor guanylyltransferase [Paenibacillus]|uniref:molybdenum cofactor guanylyltransferase n=1 Tax=Paenibacillus TaxID=44249 RepID=UPI0022B8A737|nr:molybdenum cofactor guanylyltransferase [Paenibacillus caseinilyticus]MCZ8518914.1 molybdenum cofactor guanylyltransferase [Paenibacillus caseinilyticus]
MLTGVILAGGEVRRLRGMEIGLLPYGETTMIDQQLKAMESCCSELILVTDQPRRYLEHVPRSVRVLSDYYESRGPLGGLHAAVALAQNEAVWVTGAHMPCVSPEVASRLFGRMREEGSHACLPEVEGEAAALHGVFSVRCLSVLEEMLQKDAQGQSRPDWQTLLSRLQVSTMAETELAAAGIPPGYALRVRRAEEYWRALAQDGASRQ